MERPIYQPSAKAQVTLAYNDNQDTMELPAGTNGRYLLRKGIRRAYAKDLSRDTVEGYLRHIQHPSVDCIEYSSRGPVVATAFLDEDLQVIFKRLIESAESISPCFVKSPLYPRKFSIRSYVKPREYVVDNSWGQCIMCGEDDNLDLGVNFESGFGWCKRCVDNGNCK